MPDTFIRDSRDAALVRLDNLDFKDSVKAATDAALPANTRTGNVLIADANGAFATIDGVTINSDGTAGDNDGTEAGSDYILVKNEAIGANNGIYFLSDPGSASKKSRLTRRSDASVSSEVTAGLSVFVDQGTTNPNTTWVISTSDPITLNTTSLTFAKFSGAGQIFAGTGMTKTGDTLNVIGGVGITANADDIAVDFNTTNLKITASQIDTIQDIDTTALPTFAGLTINGDADISQHMAVGADASISTDTILELNESITSGSNVTIINSTLIHTPTIDTVICVGLSISQIMAGTVGAADLIGQRIIPTLSVTAGTSPNLIGLTIQVATSVGAIAPANTRAIGILAPFLLGTDPTNLEGINIANQGNVGVTTSTAINIEDQSGSDTNNFAIKTGLGFVEFGDNLNVTGQITATAGVDISASQAFSVDGTNILSDSAGTMTLSNIDALDATTESTIEAAIDTLANLTAAPALVTVGSLNSGSITSGFGNIDNGSSNITTGQLNSDNLRLDGNTLSSEDVNGIIKIIPNGTGRVEVNAVGGQSVGGFPSGGFHITSTSASVNANAVITGHNLFGGNKQLWYLGSISGSNDNIAFINRQNASLSFLTNGATRMTIEAGGNIITAAGNDIDMSAGGRFFGGGIQPNQQALAANTNLTLDENDSVVTVTLGSSSDNNITLPAASGNEGMIINVYVTDGAGTQFAVVTRAGSDVIQNGSGDVSNTTVTLGDTADAVVLQCVSATEWHIIQNSGGVVA